MSKLVVAEVTHELYVTICKDCVSFKMLGATPASHGMNTVMQATESARAHAKETGHEVVSTYRREEKWVTIDGPPEG